MVSKPYIGIVDYGMGNLMSVSRAFETLGYRVEVTNRAPVLENASGIVLPGVGSFKDCMDNLKRLGLLGFMGEWIRSGNPYLGICLGLQILFTEGHEFGVHRGLGIIKGKVVRFPEHMKCKISTEGGDKELPLKVPHMGWNRVDFSKENPFFSDIPPGSYFYFVHSYYVVPEVDINECTTEYGIRFVSGVSRKNIIAVQFHPEKSQKVGLTFLDNYGRFALKGSTEGGK